MTQFISRLIIDLQGHELSKEDNELLEHPLVGGVILFSRNYQSYEQLCALCRTLRERKKPLLVMVDQEGGRVQRFRNEFTLLPSMAQVGDYYAQSPALAAQLAAACAWVMAAELLAVGVDISFAPVLDLQKGLSQAIGDRAFHANPHVVAELTKAFVAGMHQAGMAATGKHFPGHGSVAVDSHLATPVDEREFAAIAKEDLLPFAELIHADIDALMTAHIIFKQIDDKPVCFSTHWLQEVLRKQYQFKGIIFSDDLNMQGASISANFTDRAHMALTAGCDMILLCNNRCGVIDVLDQLPYQNYLHRVGRCERLMGNRLNIQLPLEKNPTWQQKRALISNYFHLNANV